MKTSKLTVSPLGSPGLSLLVSESKHRVRLEIHPHSATQTTFISNNEMTASNQGVAVSPTRIADPNTNCLTFTLEEHGDMVTRAFYSFNSVGAIPAIIETFDLG